MESQVAEISIDIDTKEPISLNFYPARMLYFRHTHKRHTIFEISDVSSTIYIISRTQAHQNMQMQIHIRIIITSRIS